MIVTLFAFLLFIPLVGCSHDSSNGGGVGGLSQPSYSSSHLVDFVWTSESGETFIFYKEFVRANFPEPERVISPSDSKDLERGYIQISTPLKNKNGSYIGLDDDPGELPWVHYELIDIDNICD